MKLKAKELDEWAKRAISSYFKITNKRHVLGRKILVDFVNG